jgi:aspartyl-tRNA(Asn)/glutamyl-tRNA(Gln) amidotransferase subunit C
VGAVSAAIFTGFIAPEGAPTGKRKISKKFFLQNFHKAEHFMKISREEVEHVARLARLELTEGEKEMFTGQMDAMLAYVDKLNELDTKGITPTSHAVPMENAFREDEVAPSIGIDKALLNAPDRSDNFFRVPQVIE